MWLNRKSGAVEDLSGSTSLFETQVDGWTPTPFPAPTLVRITATTLIVSLGIPNNTYTSFDLKLNTNSSVLYNVQIFKNGESVYNETDITGDHIANGDAGDFDIGDGSYTVFIEAPSAITFTSIVWDLIYQEPQQSTIQFIASTGNYTTNSAFAFNVNKQIPDIKILDFLTGLFKMFNLTAFLYKH